MRFDSAFFEKHQKRLLQIANSRFLRWILGLDRMPKDVRKWKITKISPNSIHRSIGESKYEARFFTRPCFAESLAYNVSPLAFFEFSKVRRFSPVGALGMLTIWFFLRRSSDIPWYALPLFGFATTTSYNPSGGCGAAQHYNSTNDWATAHDAGSGTSASVTYGDGGMSIGYLRLLAGSFNLGIVRYFFPFDTSAIPDTDTVQSAKLGLYCRSITTGSVSPLSTDCVIVGPTSQASTTGLNVSDFSKCGAVSNPTEVSSTFTGTSMTTSAYNEISLTSLTPVSKTGHTLLGVRQKPNDCDNSAPTSAQHDASFGACDGDDGTNRPYLSVTYTSVVAPTVTAQNNLAMLGVS